jgi:hypothetical protein
MPQCKACDTQFKDRKDASGDFVDLCRQCDNVSRKEAHEPSSEAPEVVLTESQVLFAWARILDDHDFGEGLGLLSPEARKAHLGQRANERFWDAIGMGTDFFGAVDAALGARRFRGNQTEAVPGLTIVSS